MRTVHVTHDSLPFVPERCVMALGFFDGVHLGHREVIHKAKQLADLYGIKLAVLTFDPHPREVISDTVVCYLTPLAVKEELFAKAGVDILYVIRFDRQFGALSPQTFVRQYVIRCNAIHVVAGFDFTYGRLGQGTMNTIERDGDGFFQVTTVPECKRAGHKISSTIIRESLLAGAVHLIPLYLGDFYESRGVVKPPDDFMRRKGDARAEVILHPHFTLPCEGMYEIELQLGQYVRIVMAWISKSNDGSPKLEIEWNKAYQKAKRTPVKIKWLNRMDAAFGYKARGQKRVY